MEVPSPRGPQVHAVVAPDDTQAQKVLQDQYNQRNALNAVMCLVGGMPAVSLYLMISANSMFFLYSFVASMLAFIILISVAGLTSPERAYRKLQASGRIIELDPAFIELWDNLRSDAGIGLTAAQRTAALNNLYYEAAACQNLIRNFKEASFSPGRKADQQLLEAQICSHLRPSIQRLELNGQVAGELPSAPAAPNAADELHRIQQRDSQ